jgi:hypothetical protein
MNADKVPPIAADEAMRIADRGESDRDAIQW